MSCIGKIALAEPLVDVVEPHMVVTTDSLVKEYDIAHATEADMVIDAAPWSIRAIREDHIHALVTFFDVEFSHSNVRFSTSPHSKYTHWKQAVLYLHDVLSVRKGETITGTLSCRPNTKNPRDLDIDVSYTLKGRYQTASASLRYFMR